MQGSVLNYMYCSVQGAAKKMTQHLKCDNLVTLEYFCAKFCVFV